MHEEIARHKTAISRTELSRPIRLALDDGLLSTSSTVFDYGCGLGDDLRQLAARGIECGGWDPAHRTGAALVPSDVVNLGYVVNVIENPHERREALQRAWELAGKILIVSARLEGDARLLAEAEDYADGCLTRTGTFQKFFDQQELRNWIDQTLSVSSVAAAPGVFYVFREEEDRTKFVASRYRRRVLAPRLTRSAEMFDRHRGTLEPLMAFVGDRGRLPAPDELANATEIAETFGSIRRAFRVITLVSDTEHWDEVARQRAIDLLIFLALSRFDGRPRFGRLPRDMQLDVRNYFSNYKKACMEADEVLLAIGDQNVVETACQVSELGKRTPSALYIHSSALDQLSPLLRLYEGCARGYIGNIDGANLVKLHRDEPRVSYLAYPDFERDPHPALAFSVTVHFQTFRVKYRDFRTVRNPPILHRKELFVARDHPLYSKFARLTRIEEGKGLFEDPSRIGTRDGWAEVLAAKKLTFRGHRLLREKDAASHASQ